MSETLRLYVWEDVLCDYTYGVMFALAHSAEEARALLLAKLGWLPQEAIDKEPRVVEQPEGFVVYGGG